MSIALNLHLGLPKCASTSLQRVFAEQGGARFLGKSSRRHDGLAYREAALEHLFRHTIPYASEAKVDYDQIAELLSKSMLGDGSDDGPFLVSDELLSGCGFRNYRINHFPDPLVILYRLRRIFSPLRILVVIRNQTHFLRSYYSELVKYGYNVAFEIFAHKHLVHDAGLTNLLRYDRYLALLSAWCDELFVVPFEALVRADAHARTQLVAFAEIAFEQLPHSNPSGSEQELAKRFLENRKSVHDAGRWTPLSELHATEAVIGGLNLAQTPANLFWMSDDVRSRWEALGRSSNQKLGKMIGLDLAAYGYCGCENNDKQRDAKRVSI